MVSTFSMAHFWTYSNPLRICLSFVPREIPLSRIAEYLPMPFTIFHNTPGLVTYEESLPQSGSKLRCSQK